VTLTFDLDWPFSTWQIYNNGYTSITFTIGGDGLNDSLQQLVHLGNVEEMEGEEVAMSHSARYRAAQEYLKWEEEAMSHSARYRAAQEYQKW